MLEKVWLKGQGEFDYDSLLEITSVDFVKHIKNFIENTSGYDVESIRFCQDEVIKHVDVFLILSASIIIAAYSLNSDTFDTVLISKNDLSWIADTCKLIDSSKML